MQRSSVLLYDYDSIVNFAEMNFITTPLNQLNGYLWKPITYAVTLPVGTVLATQKKDTSLYKFSLPFSYNCFLDIFNLLIDLVKIS
jgi:hypothetical protein